MHHDATTRNGATTVLLRAEDLAARWQVPRGQVYRLAREQRIPVVEIGRYKRFRLDQIEHFELAQADAPTQGQGPRRVGR
jgi:hypothetical protein